MLLTIAFIFAALGWFASATGGYGSALPEEKHQKGGVILMFVGILLLFGSLIVAWYA
jgi:hypothetical protein